MCWTLLCTIQASFQVQVGPKMGGFGGKKQPKWQDAILREKSTWKLDNGPKHIPNNGKYQKVIVIAIVIVIVIVWPGLSKYPVPFFVENSYTGHPWAPLLLPREPKYIQNTSTYILLLVHHMIKLISVNYIASCSEFFQENLVWSTNHGLCNVFYPQNHPFSDPPGPGMTPGWGIKVSNTSIPIAWGVFWPIIQFPGGLLGWYGSLPSWSILTQKMGTFGRPLTWNGTWRGAKWPQTTFLYV